MLPVDRKISLAATTFVCAAVMVLVPVHSSHGEQPGGLTRGLPDTIGGYSSTQIIVKLKPDARNRVAAALGRRPYTHSTDPRQALSQELRTAAANWRVSLMRRAYPGPFGDPALAEKHGLDRTYIIEVPFGTDTPAMAAAFAAVEDDIELATIDAIGGVTQFFPDDPYFDMQYAMHNTGLIPGGVPDADIDAPEAWELHTGNVGTVTIAIIDSGVSPHPEFETRMVPGINTYNPLTPHWTIDECPHGTHVAGIAAATGNNYRGVAGVTWGAYIMPVRVTSEGPFCGGPSSALSAGIIWAADNGADIANFSLQYGNLSTSQVKTLQDAVNYAHELGMVLISATGNNNSCGVGAVCYPARLQNCMAVGGTTAADSIAIAATAGWISNYGPETDLCAPGDDIYSTWTGSGYIHRSGTSMATPHVSGLAALVKSYAPHLTNVQIADILTTTVEDLGPEDWDDRYGYGRINAHWALLAAEVWPSIMDSSPENHAIDARQHMDSNGFEDFGWQSVDMVFPVDVVPTLTPDDFTVTRKGGNFAAPSVVTVTPIAADTVRVTLDSIIDVGAWTTIAHLDTGIVRLGFLPADVNANGWSNADDVLALVDELNGVGDPLPIWSTDINRSGEFTPSDLLTALDLLNGADVYKPFKDETLP